MIKKYSLSFTKFECRICLQIAGLFLLCFWWLVSFDLVAGLLWSFGVQSPLIFWWPVSFDLLVTSLLWSSGVRSSLIFWWLVSFDIFVTDHLWCSGGRSPLIWWPLSFVLLVAGLLWSPGGRSSDHQSTLWRLQYLNITTESILCIQYHLVK